MDSLHFTQVILQGNSFGKGYGHWTRSTTKILTSYFTGKFFWKRLRTLDTQHTKNINKLFYKEILLEKATDTGHVAPN